MVLLKISPKKGVINIKKRGKLGPQFVRPFRVVGKVGNVVYHLDLIEETSQIHRTFHVSHLWKFVLDDSMLIPFDDIQVDERLNYMERLVVILNGKTKTLCNKVVLLFKVQSHHQKGSEWTWEPEAEMWEHYRELFVIEDFVEEV